MLFDEFEEILIDLLIEYFLVQLNHRPILRNVHFLHKFEELVPEYFHSLFENILLIKNNFLLKKEKRTYR
jgi:hypothetical protein